VFDKDSVVKLIEPKSYIRLTSDGEPQLVQVYPVVNDIGIVDREHVAVYLDEDGPHVVERGSVGSMLMASQCVPLEEVTHWKSRIH
jgi:hypothetical protein